MMTGCSEAVSVNGQVSIDGQPLQQGDITFRPSRDNKNAKAVQAEITEGSFRIPSARGLMPGSYQVAITALRKTGRKIPADEGGGAMVDAYEQYIPFRYNDKTELVAKIAGNTKDLLFELELPQKP